MFQIRYEIFTSKNSKAQDKPNEDYAAYDDKNYIGIVLDGVSRDREGGIYPNPSPAYEASRIFANMVLSHAPEIGNRSIANLQEMVIDANKKLAEYNTKLGHRFAAGTVGIVFCLEKDCFHYAYLGDCYGSVIRDKNMRIFTNCQTVMVAQHSKEYAADHIRFDICNHIGHPCGYGVWDGNPKAMDFVCYGSIRLMSGDVVLLYTDGLAEEIARISVSDLTQKSLQELFASAMEIGKDDRTCVRLEVI